MFNSGNTKIKLTRKATINITQTILLPSFFKFLVESTEDFFFVFILFLNLPLLGEIEYSPVASLSSVS